ncbi:MAG TPA: rubrerythrin family protein, partial [Acidimicrobiales bacterium]|nr:rubrerythrin family protein [Acidimicrobiales bacterium]
DVEGYPDVAALFRSVAEGETGHAFGHFDFLAEVGDPATGEPVGPTDDNLRSAIAGETYEYTEMYPGFSKTAREEGFAEIAEWLETLARAEKSHAGRFAKGLESVS